jgi:hypothetical protein
MDVCAKTAFVVVRYFLFYKNCIIKCFKSVYRKCGYGNFDHRHNVSPIRLHALSGVGNFTKVVGVCANRL